MAAQRMAFSAATGTTSLSVATMASGPVTVINAIGDLDMDTAELFSRHVDRMVTAHVPRLLIVDLGELDFLGAAGIAALLAGADRVGHGGGRLRLRGLSEAARLALYATRTLDLFDVEAGPVRPEGPVRPARTAGADERWQTGRVQRRYPGLSDGRPGLPRPPSAAGPLD